MIVPDAVIVTCGHDHDQSSSSCFAVERRSSLTCVDFGKTFEHSFPTYTVVVCSLEMGLHTLSPLVRPGSVHSGSVG